MIKRLFGVVLCVLFVLAIIPVFYVSADESATALYTLTYDFSSDNGTTWTERTKVLNYDSDIILYQNQKVKLKSLSVQKTNAVTGYIYFIVKSSAFYHNSSFDVSSGNSRFYTFNGGVWGCVFPDTLSKTFSFSYTLSGMSSGTVTYNFNVFDSFNYGFFFNEIINYLDIISGELGDFHSEWYSSFLPHFDNIWTFMTQTNYSYLSFAGNGAGLNSSTTKNPLLAINGQLSALVRYFNKIQKNDYSYDSISYDSDGIGTTTTVSSVPWFDAMLGQLKGSSAIEQHHMEMENEALEAGAGDLYDEALSDIGDSYSGLGYLFGLKALRNLFNFSEWSSNSLSIISGWFTQENSNNINGIPGRAPEETVADFVSNNSDLDWFGDHGE